LTNKLTVKETWAALNDGQAASVVYDVLPVSPDNEGDPVVIYKKGASPSNHSGPMFWCCEHEHSTWELAAACPDTPWLGTGE
jgi:hypothetical protein